MPPTATAPTYGNYPCEKLTVSGGVAIFHLATFRVVLCYHSRDNYYFLPKGRKNANEPHNQAAEREGFEETGYRNRLLPLPFKHRATDPEDGHVEFATEPLWLQLMPLSSSVQYLLFWYAAETVPPGVEQSYISAQSESASRVYRPPPPFPTSLTIRDRIRQDEMSVEGSAETKFYEPVWHEGTGVDEEEALYRSSLVPVEEALRKLRGSVMADVVRRAWEAIQLRIETEAAR